MALVNQKGEWKVEDFKESDHVEYTSGYKYQIDRNEKIKTGFIGFDIETYWIKLTPDGFLWIRKGYAFDGASGIAIDTDSFFRASLVHDCIYQLLRLKLFSDKEAKGVRKAADKLMNFVTGKDGMVFIRRKYTLFAVRKFAAFAADPKNKRQVQYAPEKKYRSILNPPVLIKAV